MLLPVPVAATYPSARHAVYEDPPTVQFFS